MSEAVGRCYLGWKCDAKYMRGAYIKWIECENIIILFNFTPGEDCGPMNAMQ